MSLVPNSANRTISCLFDVRTDFARHRLQKKSILAKKEFQNNRCDAEKQKIANK